MLVGFDTNILLYSIDPAGDGRKHSIALKCVREASRLQCGLFSMQALTEFCAVVTRKKLASMAEAADLVEAWGNRFQIHSPTMADIADALRVNHDHKIAFWDAMMWSVLRRAGANLLLSEDLQDGRELEGVRFINPFLQANARELERVLLCLNR